MTRAALRALPDGTFSFEDWIDDDGIDVGKPIRLLCTITKADDRITVDWTGTSPQVKGAINNTFSFTKAASYTAVKSVISPDIPTNDGVFRAIEVIAPPGTIAHAVLPAACAARGLTGFRMLDCAFGALAMMLPDRVMAASEGGNTGITIGGWDAARRPFIYVDFACGVWEDGPGRTGWRATPTCSSTWRLLGGDHRGRAADPDSRLPARARSLGPGQVPRRHAYRRDYRLLADEAILQVRADRQAHRPYGLYGGEPGAPSVNVLNPESEAKPLPGKVTLTIRRGDVFRHELAGGGGWGDPLERDPERVLADVRDELITEVSPGRRTGLRSTAAWAVDQAATRTLRAAPRQARAGTAAEGRA